MTTANKLAEPKIRWFKTTDQLGEVRLLPSDIESKVLISTKNKHHPNNVSWRYNYLPRPLFSVFCLIKPKIRGITSLSGKVIKDVKTPAAIFQYNFIDLRLKARKNIGYLYQQPSTKKCNTLSEMLKYVEGFHFPHIYENAYMCLANRNHDSPRVLNNIFGIQVLILIGMATLTANQDYTVI